jgi:ribosomal protein S18 acetylase RimI-like enzyme
MDPTIIEAAGANAWPALHQQYYDGWMMRFSNGYTKRANSIYINHPSTLPLGTKLEVCRGRYAAHNLPTIFRVTTISPEPELDDYLKNHYFRGASQTKVMSCPINQSANNNAPKSVISSLPLAEWLSLFYSLSEYSPEYWQTHYAILSKIERQVVFLGLSSNGRVIACGMGVLDGDYFGLFSLLTAVKYRNQGFGAEILAALMNWASENGAAFAYLQVQADNSPALHLYQKYQFKPVYEYWYRIQPNMSAI